MPRLKLTIFDEDEEGRGGHAERKPVMAVPMTMTLKPPIILIDTELTQSTVPIKNGVATNDAVWRSERASKASGEAGIRTLGTLAGTLVFETSTIGHSVTSPKGPAVGRIILLNANRFQTYEGPEIQGRDSMLNSGRRVRRERKRSRPDAPRDSPPRESGASSE